MATEFSASTVVKDLTAKTAAWHLSASTVVKDLSAKTACRWKLLFIAIIVAMHAEPK